MDTIRKQICDLGLEFLGLGLRFGVLDWDSKSWIGISGSWTGGYRLGLVVMGWTGGNRLGLVIRRHLEASGASWSRQEGWGGPWRLIFVSLG